MFKHDSVLVGLPLRQEAPPSGLTMRLPQLPAVTPQHKGSTVFLLSFSKHELHFSSTLRGERNNKNCDFVWSDFEAGEQQKIWPCGVRKHQRSTQRHKSCQVVQTGLSFFPSFPAFCWLISELFLSDKLSRFIFSVKWDKTNEADCSITMSRHWDIS